MPSVVLQPRIRLATKFWLPAFFLLALVLGLSTAVATHVLSRRTELEFEERLRMTERTAHRLVLEERNEWEGGLPTPAHLRYTVPPGAVIWALHATSAGETAPTIAAMWPLDAAEEPNWVDRLPSRILTSAGGQAGIVETHDHRYRASGTLLRGEGNRMEGVLIVGIPEDEWAQRTRRNQRFLWWLAGGATVLGGILLFVWSRRLSRPLPDLMEASRHLGLGDFGHRTSVRSQDELGILALTLNDAAATLKRSRAELQRAGRIQAWHQVARQVAHEIKNPLSGMRVAAENLLRASEREESVLRESAREAAEVVTEEVESLRRLADAFSSLARLPEPHPEFLDLNHIALHAAQLIAGEAERRSIELQMDLEDSVPPIHADETQIGQILKNLLKNALEALPEGGRISLSTGTDRDHAELRIEDSGPGIPPDRLELVFEPFETTKEGGSGIGLALSRQIAEAHGGSLHAENTQSGGAAFVLRLPVSTEATTESSRTETDEI